MTSPSTRNVAIVLAVLAGAGLLVVGEFFGPSAADIARAGSTRSTTTRRSTTTTTRRAITSTTTTTTTTTTLAPVAPPATAPSTPPSPADVTAPAGEVPAEEPPAPPLAPPDGVEVASDPATCTWDEADGGTLRASGTVTNTANDDDLWLVSVDWMDGDGFFDNESDFFDAPPGQSVSWSLTVVGSEPPTGVLTCEVEVV